MTWVIGTMEAATYFDFNLKTGKGHAVTTWAMTFLPPINMLTGELVGQPNPIGLGTLQGKSIEQSNKHIRYRYWKWRDAAW